MTIALQPRADSSGPPAATAEPSASGEATCLGPFHVKRGRGAEAQRPCRALVPYSSVPMESNTTYCSRVGTVVAIGSVK